MLKLFDNCAALKFGDKNKTVVGMRSSEGETYGFRLKVSTEWPVEVWMKSVEGEMHHSLFEIMKEGVYYYAKSIRTEWITENLGMVTLAGSTIWWTWEVEDAFSSVRLGDKNAMKTFSVKLTKQLNDLVAIVRSDLNNLQRKKAMHRRIPIWVRIHGFEWAACHHCFDRSMLHDHHHCTHVPPWWSSCWTRRDWQD